MYHCTTDGMGEGKKEKHQHVVWNMIAGEDDCGFKKSGVLKKYHCTPEGMGVGKKEKDRHATCGI